MAADREKVRILLVRPWTEPLREFRAALAATGIEARISRVDIEPALNAALSRTSFDLIVLDPRTPGITRELVESLLRDHRRLVQIVMFGELAETMTAVARALRQRFN